MARPRTPIGNLDPPVLQLDFAQCIKKGFYSLMVWLILTLSTAFFITTGVYTSSDNITSDRG